MRDGFIISIIMGLRIFEVAGVNAAPQDPIPAGSFLREVELDSPAYFRQVEADWLRQASAWQRHLIGPVSTQSDARGACDGLKNGRYGFHTGLERNPWWQVDLGWRASIARLIIFNRLDYRPGLTNADFLKMYTSDDGQEWLLRYDHPGIHFGGVSGAPPQFFATQERKTLDPTYAPNDDIVFVSERCRTSLQCNEYDKDETSCNLHVMKPDGCDIQPVLDRHCVSCHAGITPAGDLDLSGGLTSHDPDYQALCQTIGRAVARAWAFPRRDLSAINDFAAPKDPEQANTSSSQQSL